MDATKMSPKGILVTKGIVFKESTGSLRAVGNTDEFCLYHATLHHAS